MKILKFGAIWCKECLVMRSVWGKVEKEIPNLLTEYYDADENPEVLEKYNVKDIPTFIFLSTDGHELLRLKGMQNREDLMEKIKQYIRN